MTSFGLEEQCREILAEELERLGMECPAAATRNLKKTEGDLPPGVRASISAMLRIASLGGGVAEAEKRRLAEAQCVDEGTRVGVAPVSLADDPNSMLGKLLRSAASEAPKSSPATPLTVEFHADAIDAFTWDDADTLSNNMERFASFLRISRAADNPCTAGGLQLVQMNGGELWHFADSLVPNDTRELAKRHRLSETIPAIWRDGFSAGYRHVFDALKALEPAAASEGTKEQDITLTNKSSPATPLTVEMIDRAVRKIFAGGMNRVYEADIYRFADALRQLSTEPTRG